MKSWCRITVAVAVVAWAAVPAAAQFAQPSVRETLEFREALLRHMVMVEDAFGLEPKASNAIAATTPEQMAAWYDLIENKKQFREAAQRMKQRTEAAGFSRRIVGKVGNASAFPPDYPPNSGGYRRAIIDKLSVIGLIPTGGNDTRCNTAAWGDFYEIWHPLAWAADQANYVCAVAGCDPTGIVCAITCAIVAGANIVAHTAGLPIQFCEVHDANVDAAEIEAAFENSVTLITADSTNHAALLGRFDTMAAQIDARYAALAGQIGAHDGAVRTQIGVHDTEIKAALSETQMTLDQNTAMFIESNLAAGVCPAWMYTPGAMDGGMANAYQGQLEEVIAIVQRTIDDAYTLGCVKEKHLRMAQHLLDLVQASAQAAPPLDCGRVCDHLRQAYKLATAHRGSCGGGHVRGAED